MPLGPGHPASRSADKAARSTRDGRSTGRSERAGPSSSATPHQIFAHRETRSARVAGVGVQGARAATARAVSSIDDATAWRRPSRRRRSATGASIPRPRPRRRASRSSASKARSTRAVPSTGLVCPGAAWFPNHSGIQEPSACCDAAEIVGVRGGWHARRCGRRSRPARRRVESPAGHGRSGPGALVERQLSPAAAEGGPAAVAVLQVQEPLHAGGDSLVAAQLPARRGSPRTCRPRRARRRADGSRPSRPARRACKDGAPCIAPRRSSGRSGSRSMRGSSPAAAKRRHGGRGQPHRQVGVDRPGPFATLRLAKKLQAPGHDRMLAAKQRQHAPWPQNWSAAWLPGIRRARVESAAAFPTPRRDRLRTSRAQSSAGGWRRSINRPMAINAGRA